MTAIVVDASTALAWCFPDEASRYADGVLALLEGTAALVPAIWALEIANALLVGERKKRLRPSEVRRFTELLNELEFVQDVLPITDYLHDVIPLARARGLSSYDAAYLELAMRKGARLATLDGKLRQAAKAAGVEILMVLGS